MKTVEGITYTTFKASAQALGLLEDDQEWERCMTEAVEYQMPYQLRNLFCTICIFSETTDPLALFNKFKDHLMEDFLFKIPSSQINRHFLANNECLKEFQDFFEPRGKKCSDYGLPDPINYNENKEETICALKEFILGN